MVATATDVGGHGLTSFDVLHLVESDGATLASCDDGDDPFAERFDLAETESG